MWLSGFLQFFCLVFMFWSIFRNPLSNWFWIFVLMELWYMQTPSLSLGAARNMQGDESCYQHHDELSFAFLAKTAKFDVFSQFTYIQIFYDKLYPNYWNDVWENDCWVCSKPEMVLNIKQSDERAWILYLFNGCILKRPIVYSAAFHFIIYVRL